MKDVDQDFVSEASLGRGGYLSGEAPSSDSQTALRRLPSDRKRYPVLPQEEVNALSARIRVGDGAALDKMVRHNLGLVHVIARRYQRKGLEFEDLVQEGTIGIMKAARKYDPAKGAFSTYATYWIRQRIAQAVIQQGRLIRLPTHVGELVSKVLYAQERLLAQGVVPSRRDIAAATELTEKQVEKMLRLLHERGVASLEQPMKTKGESGDLTISDTVADPNSIEPSLVIEARKELEEISRKVSLLIRYLRTGMAHDRSDVFIYFYGLDADRERRTLDETGKRFGLTRERIRQIKEAIWKKVPKDIFTEEVFERAMAGIPYFEEIAQGEFSWEDISTHSDLAPSVAGQEKPVAHSSPTLSAAGRLELIQARLDMVWATSRERLTTRDHELFCYCYGLPGSGSARSYKEASEYFGMKAGAVTARIRQIWQRLSPYYRHFTKEKVKDWVSARAFLRSEAKQ